MIVSHKDSIEGILYNSNGISNALKKTLISKNEGWKDYVMRLFEIGEGGYSPKHVHPWPHIIYVVGGKGVIEMEGKNHDIKMGSYAYIPNDAEHQFRNTSSEKLSFICIVPPEGD